MATPADTAQETNAFTALRDQAAADAAYKAEPENAFLRLKKAQSVGLELDTTAPVGEQGFLGGLKSFGPRLIGAFTQDAPEQLGKAAQFFGAPETGRYLQNFAEEQKAAHPELKTSQVAQIAQAEDPLSVRAGVEGAASNLPLSSGPALAGAGIGAAIGAPGGPPGMLAGAGIGYVVGSLASLPIFYGSQAQTSKESIKEGLLKSGASEVEAEKQSNIGGHLSGAVEAGGELVADIIPFHALFSPFAKPIAGQLVKSTLGNVGKKVLKTVAGIEVAEVSTEMAQQALEDQIEKQYGSGGPGATWKNTLQVVVPTALMAAIPGGFTAAHNFRTNFQVKKALNDPEADPEQRAAAAAMVFHSIRGTDPLAAHAFDVYAANQIGMKDPNTGETVGKDGKPFQPKPIEIRDDLEYLKDLKSYLDDPETSLVNPALPVKPLSERMGLRSDAGPIEAAAATAADTGAATEVNAGRAKEAVAAEQQTAPTGPISAAIVHNPEEGFTPEDAAARKTVMELQTGLLHNIVPHPLQSQKFAVQPTATPAPPNAEAEKAATKEAETVQKTAWADLDSRIKVFGEEAKDLEQKAKATKGEGEPQLPAIHKALMAVSNRFWEYGAAERAIKTALEEKRPDIAIAIVERAERVADQAAAETTAIKPGTPMYAMAQKGLQKKAERARTDADKLAAIVNPGGENAVQVPGTSGVLPLSPAGTREAGSVGQGVGPSQQGPQAAGPGQVSGQAPAPVVGQAENIQGNPPNGQVTQAGSGQVVNPLSVVEDDGDVPNARAALFSESGDAHLRYVEPQDGKVHVLGIYAADGVRGEEMLRWLSGKTGKAIVADEVAIPARGFWNKMKQRGLVESISANKYAESVKAEPLDQLVEHDVYEVDDAGKMTGNVVRAKIPARQALADIDERHEFAKAMLECLGT